MQKPLMMLAKCSCFNGRPFAHQLDGLSRRVVVLPAPDAVGQDDRLYLARLADLAVAVS